ncbi:ribosomal RNA methyltransferase NOP2 [Archaeoglobus sulfaticallidus PM70-1]|uniref:Ribosomal RNA methyltransferase NOP2 n=1 Tax=Archaeoglobus sulfaticallidus PM70-1 TaxID=387631 RepID=N0BBU7_9EURY|nr:NOL1/NOP2/sun family putative RNA methylase [Archaeoglobus sulfaticallidus]AGK60468.1 ribosomal RNA methyltransferase NOP2 [Archaeoglobus sulfaticallidus PM70-1]
MILDFPSSPLSRKLAEKYGYDEFIVRRWINFFGDEAVEIIEAMEKVPKYIRINTLKIEENELIERLEKRGFILEKTEVDYCYKVLKEAYSIGATPEYLMGYYYVMDKSSCIPPLALEPEKTDVVIDFASSPGGKTTFIAQLMENKGVILAIEVQKERIPALKDNIHRMGVMNTVIVNADSTKIHSAGIKADRILLDAPCTGEGIIHKDPTRKHSRGEKDIAFCSGLQFSLLISAIKTLRRGGVLVYSTCSMTPEENEIVVSKVLDYFDGRVELRLETIPYGDKALIMDGVRDELKNARRLYPHKHQCSGFFVAKIRKL